MCWALAHEIWGQAENETGLILIPIPVMGQGHLLNVPQFIYEFALNNYSSGKQPDAEMGLNPTTKQLMELFPMGDKKQSRAYIVHLMAILDIMVANNDAIAKSLPPQVE